MNGQDRDLLVVEPNVLRDAAWVGQRRLVTTGSVSGTTLTNVGGDLGAAGASVGSVLLYDAVPVEILAVVSFKSATVSLIRSGSESAGGSAIPPPALGTKTIVLYTFRPQLELVRSQLLRMVGIDPDAAAAPGEVTAASVVNQGSLKMLQVLGTLHLVYAAAAALAAPGSGLWERAEHYRKLFAAERRVASAHIDLDGDGLADAVRRVNAVQFVRSV